MAIIHVITTYIIYRIVCIKTKTSNSEAIKERGVYLFTRNFLRQSNPWSETHPGAVASRQACRGPSCLTSVLKRCQRFRGKYSSLSNKYCTHQTKEYSFVQCLKSSQAALAVDQIPTSRNHTSHRAVTKSMLNMHACSDGRAFPFYASALAYRVYSQPTWKS